jgi:predicted enzyme related to lactoylglutathione lyase
VKITKTYTMLVAQDMDRGVAFYRDVIGLKVGMQSPDWSELEVADGAFVALHGGGDGSPQPSSLGFDVDNVDGAITTLTAGGATLEWGPNRQDDEGIILAGLRDPEGNAFAISQPIETR